jgi:hypothetical protein
LKGEMVSKGFAWETSFRAYVGKITKKENWKCKMKMRWLIERGSMLPLSRCSSVKFVGLCIIHGNKWVFGLEPKMVVTFRTILLSLYNLHQLRSSLSSYSYDHVKKSIDMVVLSVKQTTHAK